MKNQQPHKPQCHSLAPKGEESVSPVKAKGRSNDVEEITGDTGSDLSECAVEALTFE